MTAGTSLCLQLGDASTTKSGDFGQVLSAKSADEIVSCRQGISASSLDQLTVVVSASDIGGLYSPMELANWVPLLKTDASVAIQVVGENADLQPIHTSFLLAGLSSDSERRETDGARVLVAKRKALAPISAAPLKKKDTNAVTISLDDGDVDMIDEDNLLNDDVLAPPPAMGAKTASDDCSGRKACDNCTCGRADEEAAGASENAPSSSCGKCHLGDAFRCASCPYLGKPAFKPGEEHLVLNLTDDL